MLGDTGELQLAGCIGYEPMNNEVWNTRVTHGSQEKTSSSGEISSISYDFFTLLSAKACFTGIRLRRQAKTDILQGNLNSHSDEPHVEYNHFTVTNKLHLFF